VPIYEYRAKDKRLACPKCADVFSIKHPMSEAPLSKCPDCGAPIQRVYSSFSVPKSPSTKSILSDKNLKRHGFTKLVNEGDGKFRKTI